MTLSYRSVGHGPSKVILAHTWLADHQTYAPMIPYLDKEAYTWVFPDFRGYGGSKDIAGSFDTKEMGRDLLAVADDLGWDRFHIVGNSMGGRAAQWLAGHAPKRVASMVLLCVVPPRGFPLDADTKAFFTSTIDNPEVRGQTGTAVTSGRLGAGFAAHVVELSVQTATNDAIRRYLTAWTEEDVSGDIGRYTGPVSIFVGQYDPVLTEAVARDGIVPHFPQATVATLEGSGHYPSIEIPARTAGLLAELFGAGK